MAETPTQPPHALSQPPAALPRKRAFPVVFRIALFVVFDFLFSLAVVMKVPYTEIDWIAYMQEVGGYLAGERNYLKLRGDTGPLVYPAGFVYVYSLLHKLSGGGANVCMMQYLFCVLLSVTNLIVVAIYKKIGYLSNTALFLIFCSHRIHSIFVLRLFNDGVAMFFLYLAIFLLLSKKLSAAAVVFSLGVSVKMNLILFLPGFMLVLMQHGGVLRLIAGLGAMVVTQGLVALEFLLSGYHEEYLGKAFEFSRVFSYKWTVNWRFLPESVFLDPKVHNLMLITHLGLLFVFLVWKFARFDISRLISQLIKPQPPQPLYVVYVLFVCNFIGMACARSLHPQFYVWYYHTLPFLVLYVFKNKASIAIPLVLTIEACWLVYPSSDVSSMVLLACHGIILAGLFLRTPPMQTSIRQEKAD